MTTSPLQHLHCKLGSSFILIAFGAFPSMVYKVFIIIHEIFFKKYTGVSKSRSTVVHVENNTIINKQ